MPDSAAPDRPAPESGGTADDTAGRPAPERYAPDRSLTLTDGVVAIALTLLALDLKPTGDSYTSRGLWTYLTSHEGQYIAFVIAFWVVSRYWLVHHRLLRGVRELDNLTLGMNLWFLFAVTLVPLTTYMSGAYTNHLADALLALNLLLCASSVALVSELVHRRGLTDEEYAPGEHRKRMWRHVVSMAAPALVAATVWFLGSYANYFYVLLAFSRPPILFTLVRRLV